MSSIISTLAVLSLAAGALAQGPSPITTSVFFPEGTLPANIGGSIVTVKPEGTVLALACPASETAKECGRLTDFEMTVNPTSYAATRIFSNTVVTNPTITSTGTIKQSCVIPTSAPATCSAAVDGVIGDATTQSTLSGSVQVETIANPTFIPVTITAGLEKAAGPTPTGAAGHLASGGLLAAAGAVAAAAFAL